MKTYDERTQSVLDKVEHKKKIRRATVAAVTSSAVCIFVLVVSLVLFLPFDNQNPAGAYAGVLQAVNARGPRNNWQVLIESVQDIDIGTVKGAVDFSMNAAPEKMADSANEAQADAYTVPSDESTVKYGHGGESYIENTNLQVFDIKEGDVLKESTHYFYRLRRNDAIRGNDSYHWELQLDVFEKAGLDTACTSTFRFVPRQQSNVVSSVWEMYLSDDAAVATVVLGTWTSGRYFAGISYYDDYCLYPIESTIVITLDLRDLQNIQVLREQDIAGSYRTSRMIDGQLLVATYYTPDYPEDEMDYQSYVPHAYDGQSTALVEPDDIAYADEVDRLAYTVLTRFDSQLNATGQTALLGVYADTFYVNRSRAYVSESIWRDENVTDIYCVELAADGLHPVGRVTVNGYINNQYSMDEYEGVLRVAATIYVDRANGQWRSQTTNAGLYCYRVGSWELIGKAEAFAPDGETVRAARFDGAKAYVCTAIRNTDPVYCFDLSDYAHISAVDTGTISGYSMSLTPFTDGTLAGIGVGESSSQLKVSVYRADGAAVTVIDDVIVGGEDGQSVGNVCYCYAMDAYKSYLFNAQSGVIGVPCYIYKIGQNESYVEQYVYLLFAYQDGDLRLAGQVPFDYLDNCARAAVSDNFIYLFSQTEFRVLSLATLQE